MALIDTTPVTPAVDDAVAEYAEALEELCVAMPGRPIEHLELFGFASSDPAAFAAAKRVANARGQLREAGLAVSVAA